MIQKAKAEWTKKTMPKESKTEGGGSKYIFLLFMRVFRSEGVGWCEGAMGGGECEAVVGRRGMTVVGNL